MSLKHQLSQSTHTGVITEGEFEKGIECQASGVWTCYDSERLERVPVTKAEDLTKTEEEQVKWLNWGGICDTEELAKIFTTFGLHPLMGEDVLNRESRSKFDESTGRFFVVLKIPVAMNELGLVESVHFALHWKDNTVLTFSEIQLDFLSDLDRRLDDPARRVRGQKADYLVWAILDLIVDHNQRFVDHLEERVEELEDQLMDSRQAVELEEIHELKNEVVQTIRLLRPCREITTSMMAADAVINGQNVLCYFQDLHDHASQAVEELEHLREKSSSLRELYFTMTSFRMNEVMKVLTSLSAIFLPLTFLTGIYGMNFAHMPELAWRWSYPLFLLFLALLATVLALYFKKKKWL